jgi:hypothetical protein
MGDFNSVPNPILDKLHNNSPSQKNPIYNHLSLYTDTFRHLHPHAIKFTYSGPTQQSRIDQIWLSNTITNYLIQSNITKTNPEFQSDHKIISITINSFFKTDTHTSYPSTYIKYNHHLLNPDNWQEIRKSLDENIQPLFNNPPNPQNLWNSFQKLIDSHILPKIPQKKIKTKNHNLFNKNGTLLHKQLLLINSTIYKIKKSNINVNSTPTSLIKKLNKLNLPHQTPQETIQSLKSLHKITLLQLKTENKILTQENIKNAIQKNINNLSEKPRFMIQNILHHKKPQASLQKIIDLTNNQVITDPSEIYQSLTTYYTNLFNHPNNFPNLPNQWEKEYHPIEQIQDEWYSNLLNTTNEDEIQSTIQAFPNNKAPGPSQISYDIIRNLLSPTLLKFLTLLFNSIIKTQTIPDQWKHHNIFPISKNLE